MFVVTPVWKIAHIAVSCSGVSSRLFLSNSSKIEIDDFFICIFIDSILFKTQIFHYFKNFCLLFKILIIWYLISKISIRNKLLKILNEWLREKIYKNKNDRLFSYSCHSLIKSIIDLITKIFVVEVDKILSKQKYL